jgi:hypothetical protein
VSRSGATPAPGGRPRARLELLTPSASPEEAAAIVAALEQFMRATATDPAGGGAVAPDRWRETALLEGVARDPQEPVEHPWIDAAPYA